MIPNPPSNLTAQPSHFIRRPLVLLAWQDNAGDETSFEIERSTAGAGGPFTLLANVAANVTSYQDQSPSVSLNVSYWYRVRAVNLDGPSGWSNVAGPAKPDMVPIP